MSFSSNFFFFSSELNDQHIGIEGQLDVNMQQQTAQILGHFQFSLII